MLLIFTPYKYIVDFIRKSEKMFVKRLKNSTFNSIIFEVKYNIVDKNIV